MSLNRNHSDYIISIVVTYFPEQAELQVLLNELSKQTDYVIVVDNCGCPENTRQIQELIPERGILIDQQNNSGVATAINCGIEHARELNADYVVLFDQDSVPEAGMVHCLISEMKQLVDSGCKVAAVGPNYFEAKGELRSSPFVKLEGGRLKRIDCPENEVVQVDCLITSGCLISMKTFNEVGGMEDGLFIDYVDTEWCLRAIQHGYSLFGVGAARMKHSLGDQLATLFGRSHPVRTPLRYYYLIRNGIWLIRQPWVPFSWRMMDLRRLFLIYVACSLLIGNRFENWKMMTKGVWHSLTGKMGRLQ